jgi:hypothetical protein
MPNNMVRKIHEKGARYLLDSGASYHMMMPDVEALFTVQLQVHPGTVKFCDGSMMIYSFIWD